MHYLVRVIVCADNVEEATNEANHLVEEMVDWHEFDWYTTTKKDSRWPDCWTPYPLSGETGKKMVQQSMDEFHVAFLETMKNVRHLVESYSDEQIFNNEFAPQDGQRLTKYEFSKISGYHNNVCKLFGSDGDNITTQTELDLYIKDSKDLWVVQIDCHN